MILAIKNNHPARLRTRGGMPQRLLRRIVPSWPNPRGKGGQRHSWHRTCPPNLKEWPHRGSFSVEPELASMMNGCSGHEIKLLGDEKPHFGYCLVLNCLSLLITIKRRRRCTRTGAHRDGMDNRTRASDDEGAIWNSAIPAQRRRRFGAIHRL